MEKMEGFPTDGGCWTKTHIGPCGDDCMMYFTENWIKNYGSKEEDNVRDVQ